MPLIQFEIPVMLDKQLRKEMIDRDKKTKAEVIIDILEEYCHMMDEASKPLSKKELKNTEESL